MKTIGLLTTLFLATHTAQAAPFELDLAHNEIGFSVSHLMISKAKGAFREFSGSLDFNESTGAMKDVVVNIKAASIDTREAKRDEHLRSADFFDVANHPQLTFRADTFTVKENKPTKVKGSLTIRGVTKPVTLDFTYAGKKTDPFGTTHYGYAASTKINRKDFGLTWNKSLDQGGVAVGDEVAIEIFGELVPKKEKM